MIRINLLPVKVHRKREAIKREIGIGVLILIVFGGGVFLFHSWAQAAVDEQAKKNEALKADIAKLKSEVGDYERVVAQRKELLKQRDAIQKLEGARSGPVYVMKELSNVLTPDRGPTFDRTSYEQLVRRDPNAGFNPKWDTRNVWIESWDDKERQVTITAGAKSNEDVAEFIKRLQLSIYLANVRLKQTQSVSGDKAGAVGGIGWVKFIVEGTVSY
jgi:type IV pilus assembly protein PilN